MKKIKLESIFTGFFLLAVSSYLSYVVGYRAYLLLPDNDFKAVITVAITIPFFYLSGIFIFRGFFFFFPLEEGVVGINTRQEFLGNVYVCFSLVYFDPIFKNPFIPIPIVTLLYKAMGSKIGNNSYTAGTILDPQLVTVGNNTILGMESVLIPHSLEGAHLSYYGIKIGDGVTIGARAILHGGVTVGNNAIVASGSVVTKNTKIGESEVWAGIPAKFIHKNEKLKLNL